MFFFNIGLGRAEWLPLLAQCVLPSGLPRRAGSAPFLHRKNTHKINALERYLMPVSHPFLTRHSRLSPPPPSFHSPPSNQPDKEKERRSPTYHAPILIPSVEPLNSTLSERA